MNKKITIKSIKHFCDTKILKNSKRPLAIVFISFAMSLSIINAALDDFDKVFGATENKYCLNSSCSQVSKYSIFDNSRHPAFKFVEVSDLLGKNTIAIYELYGVLAYESLKSFDDIGYGAINVYEFVGEVTYTGIKETINSYKNILGFSYNTSEYKENILGGKEIVSDSLKKNLKI